MVVSQPSYTFGPVRLNRSLCKVPDVILVAGISGMFSNASPVIFAPPPRNSVALISPKTSNLYVAITLGIVPIPTLALNCVCILLITLVLFQVVILVASP